MKDNGHSMVPMGMAHTGIKMVQCMRGSGKMDRRRVTEDTSSSMAIFMKDCSDVGSSTGKDSINTGQETLMKASFITTISRDMG